MDVPTFETLRSPVGQALMAEITEMAPRLDALALGTRLRRDHPAELVAAALGQHELRTRAVTKFGEKATRMWFTREALEQATRTQVSAHRAERLRGLGAHCVLDLGCGIGGDLIAFAEAGIIVRGVEKDELRAAMAAANLQALDLAGDVLCADINDATAKPDEVIFVDPVRRNAKGRVFSLEGLTPSWEQTRGWLSGRAIAKVMPGIPHGEIPPGVEAEWVSVNGDLVEACLWGAGFENQVDRRATLLPGGLSLANRDIPPAVGPVLRYLVEPDDAVIRAGLVSDFAETIGGTLIDPKIAWVTVASEHDGPERRFGRWFHVLDELPIHTKHLRAALRERDVGPLTVKTRGVQIVPEQLISQLKLKGPNPATIVMTRVANAGKAFLVEPLANK